MSSIARLIHEMEQGNQRSDAELFNLVYEELRIFARQLMAQERNDHTLGATALVHEVYIRLSNDNSKSWKNRAHFFSAAAESMRRILVDHARRRNALRHGGKQAHLNVEDAQLIATQGPHADAADLLTLDEAITKLAASYPEKAELVILLYFVGLNLDEAAVVLGTSRTTAFRQWQFARSWLRKSMAESKNDPA